MCLVGLNFRGFFPVVIFCSFLDSEYFFFDFDQYRTIWLFDLKPQALLLNGTFGYGLERAFTLEQKGLY